MGASDGNEPRLSCEELLHHRLLEVASLVAPSLQRRQLGVHVGEDVSDGGLFVETRKWNGQRSNVTAVDGWIVRPREECIDLSGYAIREHLAEYESSEDAQFLPDSAQRRILWSTPSRHCNL